MNQKLANWIGIELIEVSWKEKLLSTLGGLVAIYLLIELSHWALPEAGAGAVVASMGASAVLLFAVPHGALSQPWPVIGGHAVSAIIGVACARVLHNPQIAAALAVGLSIGAMHHFKCIHPPGGATAFTAVMGGESIRSLGFNFVCFPVLVNASAIVLMAILINCGFKWRRYPAAFAGAGKQLFKTGYQPPTHEQVVEAIRSLDSFVDITERDLLRLTESLSIPSQRGARG